MNIMHVLISGNTGGIEILASEYGVSSIHKNVFIFLWEGGPIAERMKEKGLAVYELGLSKYDFFGNILKIKKICYKEKIDIVIAQHESPIMRSYLYMLKKIMLNIKIVAYAHSNAEDICEFKKKRGLWLRRKVHRIFFNNADCIIAISISVKESLVKIFSLESSKIKVIYNGVDIQKFQDGFSLENTSILQFIYVGRLIEEKGVQLIIKALAKIDCANKYYFNIVGDGPYRKQLENLVKETGMIEKIQFLGDREDVPQLLKSADVFIHMPIWEEGFGITVVEAMAANCICVCAKSGGIPEIINNDLQGFLIPKHNVMKLKECLEQIIREYPSEKYTEMKINARQRALDFTIEKYAKNMDCIFLNMQYPKRK